jgi:GNAT superfamily N-acetyltransferase
LRNLAPSDLPDLIRLSGAAGWNQTDDDWLRILRLEPERCIGIEEDDHVVATATAIAYGTELAWIGMVLTLPECRGRGFARKLMEASIELCGRATIRLDASDMGKPLYESLDFVSECFVERWRRDPAASKNPAPQVDRLDFDSERDAAVFRADRSRLLSELASQGGASAGGAYAFTRPGRNGPYLGPCISDSPEAARTLMEWFVGRYGDEPTFIDIFPNHEHAPGILHPLGFRPVRRLTRMVRRPAAVEMPDEQVYAIGGFEYG